MTLQPVHFDAPVLRCRRPLLIVCPHCGVGVTPPGTVCRTCRPIVEEGIRRAEDARFLLSSWPIVYPPQER